MRKSLLLASLALFLLGGCAAPTTPAHAPDSPSPSIKVIYSDDGSLDGTTALLYLLSERSVSIEALTISYGEAHPQVYIQHMGRILDNFDITGIPLGAGQDSPLVPSEGFPEWLRQASDDFWGERVPNADKTYPVENTAELMVTLLNQAPAPLAVFVSGSNTDLAQALRLDPTIRDHIQAVYIMGGAIYVPGNLSGLIPDHSNGSAEWNIYVDPLAASEVFESGLPLILVPLDATNQVTVTKTDTRQWRDGGKLADLAADLYDGSIGRSSTNQMEVWDVMTAAIMVHPDLCELVPLHLEVVTEQGNTYGQTRVLSEGEPNVQVCLEPDAARIKQTMASTFAASP